MGRSLGRRDPEEEGSRGSGAGVGGAHKAGSGGGGALGRGQRQASRAAEVSGPVQAGGETLRSWVRVQAAQKGGARKPGGRLNSLEAAQPFTVTTMLHRPQRWGN